MCRRPLVSCFLIQLEGEPEGTGLCHSWRSSTQLTCTDWAKDCGFCNLSMILCIWDFRLASPYSSELHWSGAIRRPASVAISTICASCSRRNDSYVRNSSFSCIRDESPSRFDTWGGIGGRKHKFIWLQRPYWVLLFLLNYVKNYRKCFNKKLNKVLTVQIAEEEKYLIKNISSRNWTQDLQSQYTTYKAREGRNIVLVPESKSQQEAVSDR